MDLLEIREEINKILLHMEFLKSQGISEKSVIFQNEQEKLNSLYALYNFFYYENNKKEIDN